MHDGGPSTKKLAAVFGVAMILCGLFGAGCSRSESPAASARFEAPDQLAGLQKSSGVYSEEAEDSAEIMKQYVTQPTSSFGAGYGVETSLTDAILISAAVGTVTNRTEALDRLFAKQRGLQDVRPAEPGPLGGEARCGVDEAITYTTTICGWADSVSIGVVAIRSIEKRDRRDEFVTLRGQVQQGAAADPA